MEFLDGRIFEDPAIPDVSAGDRNELYGSIATNIKFDFPSNWVLRWHDAIRTLAKFHRVDPKSVGLEKFGKASGFYDRQIATFKTIHASQSNAVDIDTKVPVGNLPHFNDTTSFLSNKSTQPPDMGTFVHGDYKIDNIVFHKTENRVIGVLDWEMATIGHPLSDLCNLTSPYFITSAPGKAKSDFKPGIVPGLPAREECVRWYREVAGWDPTPDLSWGDAFYCFRSSLIMQGIAARYAMRQASSAKAHEYAKQTGPFALLTWEKVKKLEQESQAKSRL
jgi:aminoglycoside phosphotransferase (APT) family kinase protein